MRQITMHGKPRSIYWHEDPKLGPGSKWSQECRNMPQTIKYSLSNEAIANELGQRFEKIRLQKNLDQETLAQEIGISRKTYRSLIKGQGKISNMIKLMRSLGILEDLNFISNEDEIATNTRGHVRRRASASITLPAKQLEQPLDW